MNACFRLICAAVLAGAGLCPMPVQANEYPIAPAGTSVFLQPWDFLQYSPDCARCNLPNGVTGDDLDRHPGWATPVYASFIGVFAHDIDLDLAGAAIYLWESSSGDADSSVYFRGPDIQLGYWDGINFLASGVQAQALYYSTGLRQEAGTGLVLHSSVTPLQDFQIQGKPTLNALRISAAADGHNQVIAVAATPEPSGLLLVGSALMAAAVFGRRFGRGQASTAHDLPTSSSRR